MLLRVFEWVTGKSKGNALKGFGGGTGKKWGNTLKGF